MVLISDRFKTTAISKVVKGNIEFNYEMSIAFLPRLRVQIRILQQLPAKPQSHHKTCRFSFAVRLPLMTMTAMAVENIKDRSADAYQKPALDSKRFRNSC
jgi:hypothetical protein